MLKNSEFLSVYKQIFSSTNSKPFLIILFFLNSIVCLAGRRQYEVARMQIDTKTTINISDKSNADKIEAQEPINKLF